MPALIWALAPAKLEVSTKPLRPRAPKDRAGSGRKPAAAWSGHVISCAALWAAEGVVGGLYRSWLEPDRSQHLRFIAVRSQGRARGSVRLSCTCGRALGLCP